MCGPWWLHSSSLAWQWLFCCYPNLDIMNSRAVPWLPLIVCPSQVCISQALLMPSPPDINLHMTGLLPHHHLQCLYMTVYLAVDYSPTFALEDYHWDSTPYFCPGGLPLGPHSHCMPMHWLRLVYILTALYLHSEWLLTTCLVTIDHVCLAQANEQTSLLSSSCNYIFNKIWTLALEIRAPFQIYSFLDTFPQY